MTMNKLVCKKKDTKRGTQNDKPPTKNKTRENTPKQNTNAKTINDMPNKDREELQGKRPDSTQNRTTR